jgi:hypothetical protein
MRWEILIDRVVFVDDYADSYAQVVNRVRHGVFTGRFPFG